MFAVSGEAPSNCELLMGKLCTSFHFIFYREKKVRVIALIVEMAAQRWRKKGMREIPSKAKNKSKKEQSTKVVTLGDSTEVHSTAPVSEVATQGAAEGSMEAAKP